MPYIHIQISGAADADLTERVAHRATELTARLLGKDPALTAVVVDFIEPSRWFIAGRSLSEGGARSYHWSVSITDETNTKREKALYLQAVHEAMGALLGGRPNTRTFTSPTCAPARMVTPAARKRTGTNTRPEGRQRRQGRPASSAALPPAAAVSMVTVCSAQKRYR